MSATMPAPKPATEMMGSPRIVGSQAGKRSPGSWPTYEAHQTGGVDALHRAVGDDAVLEDGDVVGEAHHLVEAVGDVEDGGAARSGSRGAPSASPSRGREREVACEDEDAGLAIEGLGDLDHLAAAERRSPTGCDRSSSRPTRRAVAAALRERRIMTRPKRRG